MPRATDPILEDVLESGLRVVFCGTAAGNTSARLGAYYAGPRNLFWPTLHETGVTRELIAPRDYHKVVTEGIGLTDLCKHVSGNDDALPAGAFDRDGLRRKIEHYRPGVLAFTSLRAGRAFCGKPAQLGEQDARIGETRIYILPSPSSAARWRWAACKHHWQALAEAVARDRERGEQDERGIQAPRSRPANR